VGVQINRNALALNEKQLAAKHCDELFLFQVGATGFAVFSAPSALGDPGVAGSAT
jgi:hypothetical protein